MNNVPQYNGHPMQVSHGFGIPYEVYKLSEMTQDTKLRFIINDLYWVIKEKNANIDNIILFTDIDDCTSIWDLQYAINMIQEDFPNSIFCYESGCRIKDFPQEPTNEQYEAELQRQAMILEYLGFRNINVLCGFEFKIAYLYLNEAAKPIMEDIFYREIVTNHPTAKSGKYGKDYMGV